MRGRWVAILLSVALAVGVVWQVQRSAERRLASRLLARVEAISLQLVAARQAPRQILQRNLRDLRRAEELDPVESGIPLALGSQYLLLNRPQAAEQAYRDALAVEPRPEIYLNLGKAQSLAGKDEEARQSFDKAVALDWQFEEQIPPSMSWKE
ncbi:MAG: hypothetical protein SX243_17530 [Acidobacteriota bacterium]|nr:hypothetical protein [Acidobacteriota bacterium]